MAKNISMSYMAKLFNVSKATISRALNNKAGVSDDLRKEIVLKAKELGWEKPSSSVKDLGKNYTIGILIAKRYLGDEPSYYSLVYGKISSKLSELGNSCLLEIVSKEQEEKSLEPLIVKEKKCDALIIIGQLETGYLKQFENYKLPVLFYDFYDFDVDCDCLVLDNFYAGFQATEYLINNGHKKIGFVGNIYATSSIADRYLGCYRAMIKHDLEFESKYMINDREKDGTVTGFDLPQELPTAFVCNSDYIAYELYKYLENAGIKVPTDISVVSFDNTIFSTIVNPGITCIDNNVDQGVATACKVIVKKIETNNQKRYDRILIKGKIVIRDSVKKLN